jgi:Calx-beta domain
MLYNGRWLTKETTGYGSYLTGYGGTGSEAVGKTIAHNGLLFGGIGLANAYVDGPPVVTRLETTPDYVFATVNLSAAYRAHASSQPARDDNPYAKTAVRDFVYIRALDTLLVFDRMEASGEKVAATTVDKTFLLHFQNAPTITGNVILGTNGSQALRVTNLTPAGQSAATYRVVDERFGTLDSGTNYQYRLEETTKGQAQSYLINVLQARGTTAPDVTASMTEDANGFTITLVHPNRGTAVIKLAKGMMSTGGSFGFSSTGTPNLFPLTGGVEGIHVDENGVLWANPGPPVLELKVGSVRGSEGTVVTVTVIRAGDPSAPVSVQYATSNGSATAGSDYVATSGTLNFAAGETSKTFTITLNSDTLTEGVETINLTLSNPTGGASLGWLSTGVLNIDDA